MALPAHTSVLRRVIVAAALFGVLVVAHLGLQKEVNDFAYGCTGLAEPVTEMTTGEASGCAAVTSSAYADFLGVSNIVWGLLFYVVLVGLRLAYVATSDDRLRLAAFGAAGVGLLYSGYLTYLQVAEIGSFCALCLTSAATVLTLLVLHVIEHQRLRHAVTAAPRRSRTEPSRGLAALRPYAPILGLFAVLLAADVVFAAQSGAGPEETAPDDIRSVAQGTDAPPASGDATPASGEAAGACAYDPAFEPIADLSPFTNGPFKGAADAPVTVVEVFDPNCPHCKDLGDIVDPVVAAVGDKATFYYVAFPLRQESVGQVVAFNLASREGKFFELMEEMFERQDRSWGMDLPELLATVEAVGMDPGAFRRTVENEAQLQPILDQINTDVAAVSEAFAAPDGGLSVPKLAINGRIVASTYAAYNVECLTQLINEAAGSAE